MSNKEDIEWLEDIDFEEGEIRVLGERHAFVDITVFYNMRERMKKIVGSAADRIIYLSAKDHTQEFVKRAINESKLSKLASKFKWGRKKIVEKITEVLTEYGDGVARIEKIDFHGESVLTLENSMIGTIYEGEAEKPTCSYIAGLIAGAATAITNKDMECEEVECVGKGDDICRFIVKPAEEP